MAELKQSRWVQIHEPGQANFSEKDNVMDIMIGAKRCQAEATYTVRSYAKAAFWLRKYLECANAEQIIALAAELIQTAAEKANREEPEITISGEGWSCGIEKMSDGSFKVSLNWATDEPVTKQSMSKRTAKPETTSAPQKTETTSAPKKRGRKKKTAA